MGCWGSTAHQTAVPSPELDDTHSRLLQTEPPKHTEMKYFLLSTNTAIDLSPRLVDAPLTERAITSHTVHRRLVRAELHIVHLSLVGKPSTKTLLLEYIYTCTQTVWRESSLNSLILMWTLIKYYQKVVSFHPLLQSVRGCCCG